MISMGAIGLYSPRECDSSFGLRCWFALGTALFLVVLIGGMAVAAGKTTDGARHRRCILLMTLLYRSVTEQPGLPKRTA